MLFMWHVSCYMEYGEEMEERTAEWYVREINSRWRLIRTCESIKWFLGKQIWFADGS